MSQRDFFRFQEDDEDGIQVVKGDFVEIIATHKQYGAQIGKIEKEFDSGHFNVRFFNDGKLLKMRKKYFKRKVNHLCGNCEAPSCIFSCFECKERYCNDCDTLIHRKAAMEQHLRMKLEKEIVFDGSKRLGFKYNGNRVCKISAKTQAEQLGLRVGWLIALINDNFMPNNKVVIRKTLKQLKSNGEKITVVFSKPPPQKQSSGVIVTLNPGPIGITYVGNKILKVENGSQA